MNRATLETASKQVACPPAPFSPFVATNDDPNVPLAQVLPGWSVEKAKHIVGDAIKLLIYYHPDASTAVGIEAFVKQVADDC